MSTAYTLGQPVIDLGSMGKLIHPVQVDGGRWYYYWDRSGDGTSNDWLRDGLDFMGHDVLDELFGYTKEQIEAQLSCPLCDAVWPYERTSNETTIEVRYGLINGVFLALPSANGSALPYGPAGLNKEQAGTRIGSTTASKGSIEPNPLYDDMLAIWDAYNGTGTSTGGKGVPPGWYAGSYWSATPSTNGHAAGFLFDGLVDDDRDSRPNHVALEVLPLYPFFIEADKSDVSEGSVARFLVQTSLYYDGGSLSYTITGVSSTDITPQSARSNQTDFVGTAVVSANGTATISIPILADQTTEGPETLKVTLQGKEASITILDTSTRPDPVYNVATQHYYQYIGGSTSWANALSEAGKLSYRGLQGYLVTITSQVENDLVAGFSPQWTVWIAASDRDGEGVWKWMAGPEAGTQFWQGAGNGSPVGGRYANWYLPFLDNWDGGKPEGADYAILAGREIYPNFNLVAAFKERWGDTANDDVSLNGYVVEYGGLPATYVITPSATSVDEGSSVTFMVDTQNIEWGREISYSISGISAADLESGSLTGTAVVNQNGNAGVATISLALKSDQLMEGTESLRLVVGDTTSATVSVNDTTPPTTGNDLIGGTSNADTMDGLEGNDTIRGAAGNDLLSGAAGADSLYGDDGDDTLAGGTGNDTLDGGRGVDEAVYAGKRADYLLVQKTDGSWAVTDQRVFAQVVGGPQGDGIDQLVSMERLKFSDKSIAIDLDGNAGNAARTLATVFGKDALKNTSYAGIAISLFDQGMTKDQVSQVAIDAVFGANPKSTDVVKLLWKNLFDADIDASNLAYYSGLIDSKVMTAAQLTTVAADLDLTAQLIDLAGLSKTGWEYVPFGT